MTSVCPYFQVHQPNRISEFPVFAIGEGRNYFANRGNSQTNNKKLLQKVSRECYQPTTRLLLDLVKEYPELRLTFSFSGVVLDQLERFDPATLSLFQELIDTGQVEVLAETYYHSLAFFFDQEEFAHQVRLHEQKVEEVFGVTPRVFRNTELAYNNQVGNWADKAGYEGVLAEGWEEMLGWRSPNFVYRPPETSTALLLKNYQLSDDIAFRFSREDWEGWPLTADKFARWIADHNGNGEVVNLFLDYETFGEHQWSDTGIFEFLENLPAAVLSQQDCDFLTVSDAIDRYSVRDSVDVPNTTTWADTDRDLSAWLGNDMQKEAANAVYDLTDPVKQSQDTQLKADWRRLQTSDHFYYMCTKWAEDGDVHSYFNPYESPYEAYITYMNVLTDFRGRVRDRTEEPVGGVYEKKSTL